MEGLRTAGATGIGVHRAGTDDMRRRMMRSKIDRATVTDADLHHVGSVTVDRDLTDAADLLESESEQVAVVYIENGARLENYVIGATAGFRLGL